MSDLIETSTTLSKPARDSFPAFPDFFSRAS